MSSERIDAQLAHASFIANLHGAARDVAEKHVGYICHRDERGNHYWIQRYNDDGSVWCIHARDSILPGLDAPAVIASTLIDCDCGAWMPASKEQAHASRAIIARAMRSSMPS